MHIYLYVWEWFATEINTDLFIIIIIHLYSNVIIGIWKMEMCRKRVQTVATDKYESTIMNRKSMSA